MCLYYQPIAGLVFMDSIITVQKNFDHFHRAADRLLAQRIKPHKVTSNICQVTYLCSNLMVSQKHVLHQLYVICSIVILFKATTIWSF